MNQIKLIFKNMSWLMISQIIGVICGFIWTISTIRYLGVSEYGILGFAVSLTSILAVIVDLGINTHIVRDIATNYEIAPKYLGNAIPLKCLLSIATVILTLIILIIMKTSNLTITITLLFAIEMIFKSFTNLFNGAFQAFEEIKYQGITNTILNFILLGFILISVFSDFGLFGITISYLAANVIVVICGYYILVKKITPPKFEFDKEFCRKIAIKSLPFSVMTLLYTAYYFIDAIMLTNLIGSYPTGIYNATYKLIYVLITLYTVYTAVIFPVMSKFFKNNEKMLLISFEKSIKYLMLVIIPIAVATVFYSTDIIHLIYGSQYLKSSSVLSILIWTMCLLFASGALNTLLNASHKEITVTKIYFIGAIFNIALNFIMIPYLSYDGAAATTVISDVLIIIMQCYVIYKLNYRPDKKLYYDLGKIITGSAILAVALYFLHLNMILALPVGIIIYLAVMYLLKTFDNDDKYIIKEIIGRN